MAFNLTLGSFFRPWVVMMVLALLPFGSAQFCSFFNSGCVDPLAQTAVRFDFQPLFPDPITLHFGFDASASGKGEGPMTKLAFWLRYRHRQVDSDAVDANLTSEVALRVGNLTGTPSGLNNGCDGIWGPTCSSDFKSALRHTMYKQALSDEDYPKPLAAALDKMLRSPPKISCPSLMFDVDSIPVQEFAQERIPGQNVTVMSPGSGNFPWQVWYLDNMTANKQAVQVAVGIVSRGPTSNSDRPRSANDIQVELVCVQAPSGRPSKGSHD
ncbi:hypothetical protein NUU61_000911 [Penicillium alfredii]|uniref:Uncharacterized protein n=1 Tax=Penicillium alfredii TaxID=1506179 RepID=A0A9W9GAU1_9EURO|nr:uncharacterized protein NUU61_000911 [Penicillium alfredii]KAJ5115152.1 hypothetical protein NUU61_000911 [Penicillium alfredii]